MWRFLIFVCIALQSCGDRCLIQDSQFLDHYTSWNNDLFSSGLIDKVSIEQLDTLHCRILRNTQIEKGRFERYVQYAFERPTYLGTLVECMQGRGNLQAATWLLEPTGAVPEGVSELMVEQLFAIKSFNIVYDELIAQPVNNNKR